jgi:hypothetical protein
VDFLQFSGLSPACQRVPQQEHGWWHRIHVSSS